MTLSYPTIAHSQLSSISAMRYTNSLASRGISNKIIYPPPTNTDKAKETYTANAFLL